MEVMENDREVMQFFYNSLRILINYVLNRGQLATSFIKHPILCRGLSAIQGQ